MLLSELKQKDMAVISECAADKMAAEITAAMNDLDSVGGIVEVCALGLPGGIGGAMYDGLESALAPIFFGIPAVKGVEFGAGFDAAKLRGSQNNDAFYYDHGQVRTRTNNHGGILGGMSDGSELILRAAFKPTPSISKEQQTINTAFEDTTIAITGRHDPVVVPRAVVVVESMVAITILDQMMINMSAKMDALEAFYCKE